MSSRPCDNCPHLFDPHLVVGLEEDAIAGVSGVPVAGVILCPECDCTTTWSVKGYALVLTAEEKAEIRAELLGG